jgi:hypothetical protein
LTSVEHPSFNFSVFIQAFATGARVFVGADDILAKHNILGGLHNEAYLKG